MWGGNCFCVWASVHVCFKVSVITWTSPWIAYGRHHSIGIQYGFHSEHGTKNWLGCQPKNVPWPVHGMRLESTHFIKTLLYHKLSKSCRETPVLYSAPPIPAGILRNPQESTGIHRNPQESSGMAPEPSGILRNGTGIRRNPQESAGMGQE